MFTFIVVLLLIAAVFGILGAVLKIALILVLAFVLAASLLAWGGWLWFRRRIRAFEEQVTGPRGGRRSFDVHYVENDEADREPPGLGD